MSYNPHNYKHLFPKGLFGYPNRKLSNWKESQRLFALNQEPQDSESKEVAPGLVLKKDHLKIGSGFSNYVIFEIDTGIRRMESHFSSQAVYLIDVFRKRGDCLALLNLGYYYLTTYPELDTVKPPRIKPNNLVVSKGKLINLPVINRSAFICLKSGEVRLGLVAALGVVEVNKRKLSWVGSKTGEAGEVVVYNSSNIEIINENHPIMGPYRTPRETYIRPQAGNKFVVCSLRDGKVRAIRLARDRLLINQHDLVLEVGQNLKVEEGDLIDFRTFDRYRFNEVFSATSIGPILRKKEEERVEQARAEGLDNDPFLSNSPHREGLNLARACLVDIGHGKLATVSIDGIPQAGSIYPGVTPAQLADFTNELYPGHRVAVCTDPSNTVRVVYTNEDKTHIFGNTHYLAYKRLKSGKMKFWPNGEKGREVYTMLSIR